MKKKILIIGKKSFIGTNLLKFFIKKKRKVDSMSFENFLDCSSLLDKKINFIINCTSNKKFIKNNYQYKNDNDLIIAKKIINTKIKLVMISTRKVYKPKFNITEEDEKKPSCNYSKNKLISEKSVEKILTNRCLILRASNIIGLPIQNKRKLHETFVDIFFNKAEQGFIYDNEKIYKDFISITKFNEIIFKLLKKNLSGIYNISLGKKIYLSQIVRWLNFYNNKQLSVIKPKKSFNNDNFTLNNKKLMNKIDIKFDINDLKNECLKISKQIFYKK
jgi:dTDP-4-dehydrorhamnose reductase